MAQSLYRKYRPQGFDDVVGQRHITRTLRNAIAEDSVAHAYLFTGPRGTGKTTTARILAKALQCEKGPTPDPDTTCEQCIDVAEGRHPDVFELDAASRTQVENVREEIIGRLAYAPTRGRYKVYIIDEVHMLSMHSFNALLKSIEEPPERTVFILCTTHPHKVPDTIHSRCQRFDFHRIGVEDIVGRLEFIAAKEEITVAEGSLTLVAKHAAGGMRDAISTLEQLASFTGKTIALDDVEGLLGEVDVALLYELAELVGHRDIAGCFRFVARLSSSGIDMTEFVRDLTGHYRDLYVTAAVGDAAGIVDTTSEQLAKLASQVSLYGPDRLARILDLLGELATEIRWSSDARLSLEVGLTRMARPQGELTLEALAERVETLEMSGPSLPAPRPSVPAVPAPSSEHATAPAPAPVTAAAPAAEPASGGGREAATVVEVIAEPESVEVIEASSAGPLDRAHVKRAWPAVIAEVKRVKPTRAQLFMNTEVDIDAQGVSIVIEFPLDQKFTMDMAQNPENRQLLQQAFTRVLESTPPFRFQLGRGPVQPTVPGPRTEVAHARPATGGDETDTAPSAAETGDDDIDSILMNEFGAEMIAEHPHETTEGKDETP